jgi:probable HAF family extracellular repeat protein
MVDGNNNATDISSLIGARETWATDINNNGVVVGAADFGDGTTSNYKGFIFNTNFRTLQMLDGFSDFPMCSPHLEA